MTTAVEQQLIDAQTMETWESTTSGRVWLQTTTYTRHGQPLVKDISVGPNKVGAKIKISTADREMNQEQVADERNDPFRNGLLVRVDKDQQQDPATQSSEAIPAKDLLAIFGKNGNAFHAAVNKLGEVPLRRLRAMADEIDATAKQVEYLDDRIQTYRNARSQEDAVFDLSGERRPDLEHPRNEPRE